MKNDPLETIQRCVKERYEGAKAVFWGGSVSQNQGTEASDLDIVIVFESVPQAHREAFIYGGWSIDAFIHDLDTLRYFCGKLERGDGRPALIHMILQGREILELHKVGEKAKDIAQEALRAGPEVWSQNQIDRERFLITDILDDIKFSKNREEQLISVVHLFEPLIQFYFRAQGKWAASGKALMKLLKAENPDLAAEFNESFEDFFQRRDVFGIEKVMKKLLEPYGGFLWDGFRSDAPAEWKIIEKEDPCFERKLP